MLAFITEDDFIERYKPVSHHEASAKQLGLLACARPALGDDEADPGFQGLALWSFVDTGRAVLVLPGRRKGATGRIYARAPERGLDIAVLISRASYCVTWRPIDAPSEPYIVSAADADDARNQFLKDVHLMLGMEAGQPQAGVDFFIDGAFELSLNEKGINLERVTLGQES